MKVARAWAPANISLLFKVMPHTDPSKMGSLGSGFTVNEGATVNVQLGTSIITYNGKPITLPTVSEVIRNLTPKSLSVSIRSPLPLGSGFGMSGAAALSTAYAINQLVSLGKTELELAKIAHTAEVIHKTGLGDVGNQWKGGCCVKFVTSSLFQMERLPFAGTTVYVRSWGKIPTPEILSNATLLTKIDAAGDHSLAILKKHTHTSSFSFAQLLNIASTFTRESELLSYAAHARKVIQKIAASGGHAAMIILGDAVVSDTQFEGSMPLVITQKGVRLV